MSKLMKLKAYSVGPSLSDSYIPDLSKYLQHIDCLEVKPEHYFHKTKSSINFLDVVSERIPVICHGLKLSIGSAEGISKRHLQKLNRFFRYAPPIAFMSEHTGLSRAGGVEIPHFVNLPMTSEMIDVIAKNISTIKHALSVPVIFENIPWEFCYPESEMSEEEFFARLVKKTNCGLLFDVTNLYANHINFGWDIDRYLKTYPLQNVVQVHYNGGHFAKDGTYIDSHSHPTPPEVWDILRAVVKSGAPVKAFTLERDDDAKLEAVIDDLIKMKTMIKRYGTCH